MLLGQRLKKTREDAGLTIKKFGELSKIQTKYLEYLEEGRYEKLPAFVYIHGFLEKYSQILNIQLDELVVQYQNEMRVALMPAKVEFVSLPSLSSPKIIITPKKLKWAAVIIVLLAIVGYFIYQLDYLVAPPKLVLEYPAQDLTINSSSVRISGQAEYSAKLTINGEQIFIDNEGRFNQEINLSPGLNTLKIKATNRFGKTSEITRQIVVAQ